MLRGTPEPHRQVTVPVFDEWSAHSSSLLAPGGLNLCRAIQLYTVTSSPAYRKERYA